jgi:adenylate cyclase
MNGQRKTVEGKDGQRILQIALDNGVPMEHACGGNGFCTTCLCQIKAGAEHLSPRNDREENMGVTVEPYRLGCQTRIQGTEGEVEVELSEG